MAWYKTGTVSVTNGSTTVTGAGTAWVANARVGQAFALAGSSAQYEITAVVSDTELTISPAYLGSTQTGQAYAILPLVGFYREAYDALAAAVAQWSTYLGTVLSGLFSDGTAAAPGLGFKDETSTGFFRKAAGQLGLAVGGVQRALLSSTAFKIDVPVTGTAVTQSATDTTAGRLLKVGDFGLGADSGILLSNVDTNDGSGYYWGYSANHPSATPGTNPFNLNGAFWSFQGGSTLAGASEYNYQVAGLFGSNGNMQPAGSLKWRAKASDANGWGAWTRIITESDLIGTVSQSGGDPTGAIIERGSNANGEYVRFADGTQICWVNAISTSDSATTTWTFPAAFTYPASPGRHVVSGSVATTFADGWRLTFGATANGTSIAFNAVNTSGARVAASAHLTAIGRWF